MFLLIIDKKLFVIFERLWISRVEASKGYIQPQKITIWYKINSVWYPLQADRVVLKWRKVNWMVLWVENEHPGVFGPAWGQEGFGDQTWRKSRQVGRSSSGKGSAWPNGSWSHRAAPKRGQHWLRCQVTKYMRGEKNSYIVYSTSLVFFCILAGAENLFMLVNLGSSARTLAS